MIVLGIAADATLCTVVGELGEETALELAAYILAAEEDTLHRFIVVLDRCYGCDDRALSTLITGWIRMGQRFYVVCGHDTPCYYSLQVARMGTVPFLWETIEEALRSEPPFRTA